jgi:RND family efflux transporter MFP subunit
LVNARRRRKLLWSLFLLVLIFIAAAGSYWFFWRAPPVAVAQVERGPAVRAVYATGVVEPTVSIPIAPRAGGRIVQLLVDEGDRVSKGQVLVRLEDADLRRTVEELEARERYAGEIYQRTRTLVERGLIAEIQLDQARAEWQAARAATQRAREQLDFMTLHAPADGYILRRDGEVGEYVPVNQAVFFMSTDAPLRIAAEVDEEDIPLVAVGQDVLVNADAFPERVFEGRVEEITPKGDPVSRSYRVRVSLPGNTPLKVGMTADTNIIVARRENALLVPASALANGYVWVVRDGRLARQPVQAGIVGDRQVEIRSGLNENDWVVVLPKPEFENGQRVKALPYVRALDSAEAKEPI